MSFLGFAPSFYEMAQEWRKIGANGILGGFLNLLSFGFCGGLNGRRGGI